MTFIISLVLGSILGFKLRGAVELFKQVRQINYIEKTVEKILSKKELKVIDFRKKDEVI